MVLPAHANSPTEPLAVLKSVAGIPVPLKAVTAKGRLEGLLFELIVEQRYENTSPTNLEAVFTFPLPLRAVLLGFDLEIGGRKLEARAVARQKASEDYERAIDAGDTAALIEHDGNGLHTVSLGNLAPKESAVIRYRYAELLDAHDGYVRVGVPTVIAPRYGNPRDAGLEGPAIPGVDLLGEYPFEISLELVGVTSTAGVRSPSHRIETASGERGLSVRLAGRNFLDRDFVLELKQAALPQQALVARDGDGYVLLASATLGLDREEQRPLALKILLDCSGSMGGDSIAAAKRALLAILERLTPADRVSLTRFGTRFEHVTEGLEPADAHTLTPLKAIVRGVGADMGGTQMQSALTATLALEVPREHTADLILITDGEIYDVAGVVERAAQSRHRLFAIAIGAAPVEALARSLAENTGGACEFVGPGEDAEGAILRTFKRLRSIPRSVATIGWPTPPTWTAPLPTAVFPGDTLHAIAGFRAAPTGTATLTVRDSAGHATPIHLPVAAQVTEGDLLPRLAAARRLGSLDEDAARELAVAYQLATKHTSFVVVAQRADAEKAKGLPATVAVPHMLAAGWAGSASLAARPLVAEYSPARMQRASVLFDAMCERTLSARAESRRADTAVPRDLSRPAAFDPLDSFDLGDAATSHAIVRLSAAHRAALLAALAALHAHGRALPQTLGEMIRLCADSAGVYLDLNAFVNDTGESEADVVRVLLALLAEDEAAVGMDPGFLQALRGDVVGRRNCRELRRLVHERLFQ